LEESLATRKQKQKPWADERYDVFVWDHEGDVVKSLWDATYDEVEEVREQFADDPLKIVVVEERS
jgi:hypothetical protein